METANRVSEREERVRGELMECVMALDAFAESLDWVIGSDVLFIPADIQLLRERPCIASVPEAQLALQAAQAQLDEFETTWYDMTDKAKALAGNCRALLAEPSAVTVN